MPERHLIPAADLDESGTYKLLTGTVVPRPIAWVSTVDTDGRTNLAPYSFFTAVSIVPPMLAISVEPRRSENGASKDTLRNVRDVGEFVVNTVTDGLVGAVTTSAEDIPPKKSEFERAGLTAIPSRFVEPPRVAEAPVAMECRLQRLVELGSGPHTLVIGEVVAWHVSPDVLDERGRVDFPALAAVGRMAGDYYVRCTDLVSKERRDSRGGSYR